MLSFVIVLGLSCAPAGALVASKRSENPTFMMVSGVSSSTEMCLTVENGAADSATSEVGLESCSKAIAAGDGRELWQYLPNGQIASVLGKKCMSLHGGDLGSGVSLMTCDEASAAGDGGSQWEAQGNGQLKSGKAGQYCLSQKGATAAITNIASHSAISASSSADPVAHGASKAVDGSSSTFWASALDPAGPVTITIDLGSSYKLEALDIDWEFPAKSFSVGLSLDGVRWVEAYATDSNVLTSTAISLGSTKAAKVRVIMHEAHAVDGTFKGHAVFGIASLQILAKGMQTIVEDCSAAAKSKDARDKYFQTFVGDYGSCSSKALRSELPSLEAASSSVTSAVTELFDIFPKLAACHHSESFLRNTSHVGDAILARAKFASHATTATAASSSQLQKDVDAAVGFQSASINSVLKIARQAVITARAALF